MFEAPSDMVLEDLDFSVRTYHCLKRCGIDTLDELCNLDVIDMCNIRNLGAKCMIEIEVKLESIGRELKSIKLRGVHSHE